MPGELMKLSFWFPRNPALQGWHFIVLTAVFNHQEQFADEEQFRKWCEVGAGHCDFVPGPKGKVVAIPKSIAWHEMDDHDFGIHHEKVIEFFRSLACTRYLWPHMSDAEASEMMEGILTECEVERERIKQLRAAKGERAAKQIVEGMPK